MNRVTIVNFIQLRYHRNRRICLGTAWGVRVGSARPQVFRRKWFACLAQTGKSFSQLLPLYMETFWRVIQRWRSWEMPCARQADFRRFVEVIS